MSEFSISWLRGSSRLSKSLATFIESKMMKFVPSYFSQLHLILLSNFWIWLALVLVINPGIIREYTFQLIPFILLLHIVSGYLAALLPTKKLTATQSRLNTFLDHYQLTLNVGVILYIVVKAFALQFPILISGLLVSICLNGMAVFYRQFKSGELHFPVLGYTEGVVFSMVMITFSNISVVKEVMISTNIAGFSLVEIMLLITIIIVLTVFVRLVGKISNARYSVWMFLVLLVLNAIISSQLFGIEKQLLILTLYAGLYIGKILTGYFIDGVERSPGLFTPLFLIVVFLVPELFQLDTFLVLAVYLSASNILLVYRFFKVLKKIPQ